MLAVAPNGLLCSLAHRTQIPCNCELPLCWGLGHEHFTESEGGDKDHMCYQCPHRHDHCPACAAMHVDPADTTHHAWCCPYHCGLLVGDSLLRVCEPDACYNHTHHECPNRPASAQCGNGCGLVLQGTASTIAAILQEHEAECHWPPTAPPEPAPVICAECALNCGTPVIMRWLSSMGSDSVVRGSQWSKC